MDELLKGLNGAQRSAVTSPASVLQVLAPPGSGKTKTLTARVAYLVDHHGFRPWNVIVCTFTIKAAREMKERIQLLLPNGIERKLILGTFHSVARRFLLFYGQHIGIDKNFGIADSSDTLAILKRITKRSDCNIEPSAARSKISSLKAKCISCEEYAASQKQVEKQQLAGIYREYEETLKSSNLLDYDDLLLRCAQLLREHPECVSNIEAVLIDEFQDTNNVQYDLMTLFAQKKNNVTIVGDPDQSIYGFRSAEIKNLKRMRQQYPETIRVILEENYRSSGAILLSALEVIEQDESRPAKKLLSTHCVGASPVLRKLPSAQAEAKWIVAEIQRSIAMTGRLLTHKDFAILLRSASLSRHVESELGRAGIPYRMVGGHRFFDRVEVKLLLDYLRVVNQPEHNDALARIINVPSRKIGEVTVRSLLEEAEKKKQSLWRLVLGIAQGNCSPTTALSRTAQKGLELFVNIILTSHKKLVEADAEESPLLDLLGHLIKRLDLEGYIKKMYPEDFEGRWANVQELIAQATDMITAMAEGSYQNDDDLVPVDEIGQRQMSPAEDALGQFLANVALSTEVERADKENTVSQVVISTIHAAKGLEWPVVFIPSAYNGSIPHSRSEDTDEERRLLYVAMTRAQSLLYISCPTYNSQREQTNMSPFLTTGRVSRLFDPQGPSFLFSTAQDLARILRRPCPTNSEILAAMSAATRAEDDYWPLDGADVKDARPPEPGRYPDGSAPKRRRTDSPVTAPTYGYEPTMQAKENYSVSTTTMTTGFASAKTTLASMTLAAGFTTARSHLRALEDARANAVTNRPPGSVSERGSYALVKPRPGLKAYPVTRPAGVDSRVAKPMGDLAPHSGPEVVRPGQRDGARPPALGKARPGLKKTPSDQKNIMSFFAKAGCRDAG